ncbi:MAG: hypothetical protein RLW62_04250 [Gammaproteobacteria bacterium]
MGTSNADDRQTPDNQGEGNREAAREYNEAQREFVREGKVEEQATDRREMSEAERREAEQAEAAGKARAREKDPNVVRDYDEGST